MDALTQSVGQLQIGSSRDSSQNRLDNVPRFVFRVVSPDSDGKTDETWACSEAAMQGNTQAQQDALSVIEQDEREKVARALNVHLWWMKKANPMDNFVSWTSSLPFAIQYVFYRHLNDKRPLEEIKLFVIDTTQFRQGTFIRDLNLIEEFQHDNPLYCERTLPKLWEWRTGNLYFGEYLSQGSLGIAGKCQVISLKASADDDSLFTLQPRFSDTCRMPPGKKRPEWVYPVLNLRKEIFSDTPLKTRGREDMADRMKAVLNIANRFEPGWKLPMAVYFAALICKRLQSSDELMLLECFATGPFSGLSTPILPMQQISEYPS